MINGGAFGRLDRTLLYEQLAERVRELIKNEGLWGKYLPPERELARDFGVSQDTVRRGLQALAEEGIIIRRQGRGTRVLAKPRTRRARAEARVLLASAWGREGPPYAGRIMAGLGTGASEAGWSASFAELDTPGGRAAFLETLRFQGPDGLVLISVTDCTLAAEALRVWNGPAVLVDHHFPDLPITSVRDDSRAGARAGTEHLLSLGHRRIGYVDMSEGWLNPWRREGYLEALTAAGVEPDPALVVSCAASVEAGRAVGEELLSRRPPPTAVLTFDDLRAWGVWQAAERRGLRVGRDFAVVGCGEDREPPGGSEGLTLVKVNAWEVGRAAARELSALMAGRSRPGREVLLPAELIIRGSTREVRLAGA